MIRREILKQGSGNLHLKQKTYLPLSKSKMAQRPVISNVSLTVRMILHAAGLRSYTIGAT